MPIAVPFIRNLEGNMRLRTNNKPVPDYAKGFKNPVPPPNPGGNGILSKFLKLGGKFASIPLYVLIDFFSNQKGFSDGGIPSWIKDIEAKEVIYGGQYNPLVEVQASTDKFHIFGRFTSMNLSGGGCNVTSYWRTASAIEGNKIASLDPVILPNNSVAIRLINGSYQNLIERNNDSGTDLGDINSSGGIFNLLPQYGCLNQTGISAGHTFKQTKVARQNNVPLDPTYPGSTSGQITTNDNYFATGRALIDQLSATDWKFSGFTELPTIKPGKITQLPDFFKLPEISPIPAVIPTEIPEPLPDPDPDVDRKAPPIEFPNPGETQYPKINPVPRPAKSPIPNEFPEPKINPDPQPDVNPKPDVNPNPKKKWSKITTYLPDPPVIIKTTNPKPPIILDKTPIPLPLPEPVKPPPPIQTPVDKCADHCGGGTIDFDLPDDSELAELLKAIKKKVDEIEESVNQTLAGSIEVGSCKIPDDQTNETDEIVYVPDPAQQIIYTEKGLKAIHTAIQGIETKLTGMHEGICIEQPSYLAAPDWWQVRLGANRPQIVCTFRRGATRTYHSLSIPHPRETAKPTGALIPEYQKGNWQGMIVLNDNSKFIVNCSSSGEAERICSIAASLISGAFLPNPLKIWITERKGEPVKSDLMIPTTIMYYPTGQKNTNPDWYFAIPKETPPSD